MKTVTYRAYSRTGHKNTIRFSEGMKGEYHKGKLLNKSSGGMSFISDHELKPGTGILINVPGETAAPNGARPASDYVGEVRWCVRLTEKKDTTYRVGVRLFSRKCLFCGKEIRRNDTDTIDVCEECRKRGCFMSNGKIESCIENYLLGNVL